MELRPGYKQTEIGPIPEDWEAVPLGDLFTFKNGLNKAKKYFGYGTPIVNYMDVFRQPGLRLGRIEGRVDVSKSELEAFEVRKGDVFFTRTSETVEEIGVAAAMLDPVKDTVFSGFVLRARPTDDRLDDLFKAYCFSPEYFRRQVIARATYTTRALTNGRSLSAAFLAVPPIDEQRDIARALSDTDEAISEILDLIEKKRDIRSGAIQQLMTGKGRLAGFSKSWEIKKLGELLRIKHGKSQRLVEDPNGEYPILATGGQIGKSREPLWCKPSVLIGRKGTIDRPQFMDTPFWSVDTLYYSDMLDGNVAKFLFYRFLLIEWRRHNEASGVPSLSARTIESIEIQCPDPSEQQAIVDVLTDMDSEITALEARLEKTRALKQGMMQALLTGRVRLPVRPEALDALEVAHA
jgi:type I restriction enzyme S subunit